MTDSKSFTFTQVIAICCSLAVTCIVGTAGLLFYVFSEAKEVTGKVNDVEKNITAQMNKDHREILDRIANLQAYTTMNISAFEGHIQHLQKDVDNLHKIIPATGAEGLPEDYKKIKSDGLDELFESIPILKKPDAE